MRRQGRWPTVHMVHGEHLTVKEAARRLRVTETCIESWRTYHKGPDGRRAPLEAAYDWYTAHRGEMGRIPRKHLVRGRLTTIRALAEASGMPHTRLRQCMRRCGCGLQEAMERCERERVDRAVRKIIRIIYGEA